MCTWSAATTAPLNPKAVSTSIRWRGRNIPRIRSQRARTHILVREASSVEMAMCNSAKGFASSRSGGGSVPSRESPRFGARKGGRRKWTLRCLYRPTRATPLRRQCSFLMQRCRWHPRRVQSLPRSKSEKQNKERQKGDVLPGQVFPDPALRCGGPRSCLACFFGGACVGTSKGSHLPNAPTSTASYFAFSRSKHVSGMCA